MTDAILIMTTTPDRQVADRIAQCLLGERLAACIQVSGPIHSTYRWQGKVETAEEWLCTIKTTREAYGAVEQCIVELHPYDEPEVVAVDLSHTSASYLQWLRAQIGTV